MALLRHLTPALGHATTIIACDETQLAMVVDPGRDIRPVLALADEHELEIRWVADTHGHNDYLSGLSSLVHVTGAEAVALTSSPDEWASLRVAHGEQFAVGSITVEVLHTPGHTPEHTAFLVREPGAATPVLVSGGSLLCGDVGRPDLLGGAGDIAEASATAATTILDVILPLGDSVRVLPTHVAGSLCAGAIGSGSETTIGDERRSNPSVLAMLAEREGAEHWLDVATLPPVPAYWRRMRTANVAGVELEPAPPVPPRLLVADAAGLVADGALVVDARTADEFAARHVAWSLFVPAGDGFATWAGSTIAAGQPIVLVTSTELVAARATLDAWRIGIGPVLGHVLVDDLDAWAAAGAELTELPQASIGEAFEDASAGAATLIDVRAPLEHRASPIPGALELPATLLAREPELAPEGPLLIACASGMRSTVIASLLARSGRTDVRNVRGGTMAATAG